MRLSISANIISAKLGESQSVKTVLLEILATCSIPLYNCYCGIIDTDCGCY